MKYISNGVWWKNIVIFLKWNIPHFTGVIDRKHEQMHVSVTSPFNYKRTHSVVLLATCNNKCSLTLVDVADSGQNSENCIISNSRICRAIIKN